MREVAGRDAGLDQGRPLDRGSAEQGSGRLELSSTRDADDGRILRLSEGGRPTGVLRVHDGVVTDLRVARDDRAHERVQTLLTQARTDDGGALDVQMREPGRPASPDHVDLRNPDDAVARDYWERAHADDLGSPVETRRTSTDVLHVREAPPMSEVDVRHPGLYERSPQSDTGTGQPFTPPEAWVGDINDSAVPTTGRLVNCGDCARAVESRWRGSDAVAASCLDVEGEPDDVMEGWTRGELVATDFDEVHQRLLDLGPGSSAIVGVDWQSASGGHWFNALNDGGTVRAVDGQSGRIGTWPPSTDELEFSSEDTCRVEAIIVDPQGRHLTADDQEDAR